MLDTHYKPTNWTSLVLLLIFMFPVVILGNVVRIITQTNLQAPKAGSTLLPFFGERVDFYALKGLDPQMQITGEKSYLIPTADKIETENISTQFGPDGKFLVTINKQKNINNRAFTSVLWEINGGDITLKKELDSQYYFDKDNGLYRLDYQLQQQTPTNALIQIDIITDGAKKTLSKSITINNINDYTLARMPVVSDDKEVLVMHFKDTKTETDTDINVFLDLVDMTLSTQSFPSHSIGYLNHNGTKYSYYHPATKDIYIHNITTDIVDKFDAGIDVFSLASKGDRFYISGISPNLDPSNIILNDPNQVVMIVDSKDLKTVAELNIFMREKITKIIPANDDIIIVVNEQGVISFVDMNTEGVIKTITNPQPKESNKTIDFYHDSVSLSPDSKIMTAADTQSRVFVWNIDLNTNSKP
jgi:hypothetical protein